MVPGGRVRIALRLRLAEGWHTYWHNPGEAGVPVELTPTLSRGATSGPIAWPAPGRISEGDITSYGYFGDVVLPIRSPWRPGSPPFPATSRRIGWHARTFACRRRPHFIWTFRRGGRRSAQAPLFLRTTRRCPGHHHGQPDRGGWHAVRAWQGTEHGDGGRCVVHSGYAGPDRR